MDGWAGLSDGAIRRRAALSGGGLFLLGRKTVNRGAINEWTGLSGLGSYFGGRDFQAEEVIRYFLAEGENASPFVHLSRWSYAAAGGSSRIRQQQLFCALCFVFCFAQLEGNGCFIFLASARSLRSSVSFVSFYRAFFFRVRAFSLSLSPCYLFCCVLLFLFRAFLVF